jgi:hypothetical protein
MSTLKSFGSALWAAGKLVGKATVATTKFTGEALHSASTYVADHKDEIAAGAKVVVRGAGTVVRVTGQAVHSGAKAVATELHGMATESDSRVAKVAGRAAGYTVDAVGLVGRATAYAGDVTERSAPLIGAATGGLVTGTVGTVSQVVDAVAVSQGDIDDLTTRFRKQSLILKGQSARRVQAVEAAIASRRKKDLLDLLVVGGMTLSAILAAPSSVPPEVERAFEMAYPGLAAGGEQFADAVQRMDSMELLGLVNGVKGKLFEIELVEHLNNGNLPDGLQAEMAESATQPGFDLRIVDQDGHVVDVLQAKATESAAYVQAALEKYPDIDVMTTTEVHSHLVALGAADQVTESGISETVLQAKVEAAAHAADGVSAADLLPSGLGMAIIALSVFTTKGGTAELLGEELGQRTAQATLSTAAGKVVMVATGTWWVSLAAGVGTRWLASHGGNKRERLEALRQAVEGVEATVKRNRQFMIQAGGALLPGRSAQPLQIR